MTDEQAMKTGGQGWYHSTAKAAPAWNTHFARAFLPLSITIILGVAYLTTLRRGPGYSGDTAKFGFVGAVLGTPHATGYPLYTVLTHLFTSSLPFGSIASRANLLSSVFSVLACVVLYFLVISLSVRRFAGFVTALVFGATYTLWSQAVVAEVYTLHILLVALVLLWLVRWKLTGRHFT